MTHLQSSGSLIKAQSCVYEERFQNIEIEQAILLPDYVSTYCGISPPVSGKSAPGKAGGAAYSCDLIKKKEGARCSLVTFIQSCLKAINANKATQT